MRFRVPLTVEWGSSALHDLERLDRQTRDRITNRVGQFARTGAGDVVSLQGNSDIFRLRIGDWRVIFAYDNSSSVVRIARVKPRSSAYMQ